MATINELKEKIKVLKSTGLDEQAKKFEAELAALEGNAPAGGGDAFSGADDAFETDMTPEELEDVPSGIAKRPPVGIYPAVIGVPEPKYSERAAKIPFKLVDSAGYTGTEDAFYPSRSPGAEFSIKNIAAAAGVKPSKNPVTGKAMYKLMDFAGKRIRVEYDSETKPFTGRDGVTRDVTTTKARRALPA